MKKILIVEDEQAYAQVLYDRLTVAGYQVSIVGDGEKGLAFAKAENPDLILLDIRLPKMDGMTMLDLLRQDKNGKLIKVIILTNIDVDDRIIQQVVKSEPSYYCIKSDTKFDNLMEKIKNVLDE